MKFIDLFAGVGGFRLGMERAGHECVWSCEIDRWCQAVYRYRFKETPAGDARRVDPREVPDHDCLCAGFPCQSFSVAGKRGGFRDPRGTLFYEICRLAGAKRPRLLLLENVKGLLSIDRGETFATVLQELGSLGCGVEWQVLNSKNWGVPQNRQRVYIVGHLGGLRGRQVFPVPEPDGVPPKDDDGGEGVASCLDANYHKGARRQRTFVAEGGPMTITQTNPHSPAEERKIRLSEIARCVKAEWSLQQQPLVVVDRRWDEGFRVHKTPDVSPTIRSCESGGGKTYNIPAIVKDARIRRLTPRECERLQGFPDDWTRWGIDEDGGRIEISDTQRYKMMGNAVTVPVVEFIAKRLQRHLRVGRMTDIVSREKRSEIMSRIHQPTKLEKRVHDWLCGAHVRHRMYPKVEGRPDIEIENSGNSFYVFVDGCFWHCCPTHYRRPKSNQEFWVPHVEESNRRREERRRKLPYRWMKLWGHEVRDGSFKGRVLETLGKSCKKSR